MSWQPTVEKDFYLVRDLCAISGLSKPSVYDGIEKGELPGYKIGNRYVIPGPAFRAFAEGTWVSPIKRLEVMRASNDEEREPASLVHPVNHRGAA